jgi:hypothetical protein
MFGSSSLLQWLLWTKPDMTLAYFDDDGGNVARHFDVVISGDLTDAFQHGQ